MKKVLPNVSLEWISSLGTEDAKEFKNKFVCYELKEGILKLTFFLNPRQSYSRHEGVATRKFKELNSKIHFATKKATLTDIDRSRRNLAIYIYSVDNKEKIIIADKATVCSKCEQKDILLVNGVCKNCDEMNRKNDFLANDGTITVTKENIGLYYEFMSDEDLLNHKNIIYNKEKEINIFDERKRLIESDLNINLIECMGKIHLTHNQKSYASDDFLHIGLICFGVKDTLKHIDEFIEEIKKSEIYKDYMSNAKKCSCCSCAFVFYDSVRTDASIKENGANTALCVECSVFDEKENAYINYIEANKRKEASFDISMIVDLIEINLKKQNLKLMMIEKNVFNIVNTDGHRFNKSIGSTEEWKEFIEKEIGEKLYSDWSVQTGGYGSFENAYNFSLIKK